MSEEENKPKFFVGTLLQDMGKIGVISKVLQSGALKTEVPIISWRLNYEISYIDGDVQIIGEKTLLKLIDAEIVKILS
tara:strand:+ start:153 stop:386 length:234 start_codon:yes stop_codon:yes gene_type:complete